MSQENSRRAASDTSSLTAHFEEEAAAFAGGSAKSAKDDFVKVSTGNPLLHELVDRRIVRLTGPIDDGVATAVIATLQLLDDMEPGKDIELRINSPGGSVTAGLAIYDAMKSLRSDVRTVCEGQCASMAAVLLAAGTPGKRVALPSSRIMIHGPSGGFRGTDIDMNIYINEMQRLKGIMIEIISQYTGMDAKRVESLMERDNFMSPKEAKLLRVIDEIREPRHKPPANDNRNTPATGLGSQVSAQPATPSLPPVPNVVPGSPTLQ